MHFLRALSCRAVTALYETGSAHHVWGGGGFEREKVIKSARTCARTVGGAVCMTFILKKKEKNVKHEITTPST
jgi:hypothetical protein